MFKRTIFRRFRERNSRSTQGQTILCACPENPTDAWLVVKLSHSHGSGSSTHRSIDEFSETRIQMSQNWVRRASLPVTIFDMD